MRRLSVTLFSFFSLALFSAQAAAQQRLGLMPERFTLRSEGQTYEAEAFCLDRHLIQRREPVAYGQVLAGQARVRVGDAPPISLQEALRKGVISVKGRAAPGSERFDSGLSMTFVSHVRQPITVELAGPVAFGQKPSWINPEALKPLSQPRNAYASKLRQDMVWRADTYQRRLQVLGYYKGSPHEVNLPELNAATRDFQRAHGLPATGAFDPRTRQELDQAEAKLREDFARIGVRERAREDTTVQDVTDVIRRYEGYLGLKEEEQTGLMSDALRAHMVADEAVLRQVSAVAARGRSAVADLDDPGVVSSVLTFQLYRDGADVMVKGDTGPELWRYFDGKVSGRYRGSRAVREFDNLSLEGAATNSSARLYILQTGAYSPGGNIRVAFGPGPVLELTPSELARFVEGAAPVPAFDERVAELTAAGGQRPRVFIWRSALNQGRGGGVGGGTPLGFEPYDPLQLKAAVDRRYGDKVDVAVGNNLSLGLDNFQHQIAVSRGSQIRVYADRTNFKDYGTVASLKHDLRDAGIEIVQAREAVPGQPGVIIITTQRNAQSRAYLMQLAAEGRFKNSFVALAACGSGCDELAFNSKFILLSGARGVLFYAENIHPEAVKLAMLKFCELMSKKGGPDSSFQRLWRESVEELLGNPKTPMREEVLKLLNAYIQVSRRLLDGGPNDADE